MRHYSSPVRGNEQLPPRYEEILGIHDAVGVGNLPELFRVQVILGCNEIEPLIGAVVLTMWIGAYAIVFGVFLLVLAFQLHSRREEHKRKAPATAAAKKA